MTSCDVFYKILFKKYYETMLSISTAQLNIHTRFYKIVFIFQSNLGKRYFKCPFLFIILLRISHRIQSIH